MRRRKTKGSSMIIVIAIFGILSILGTSMLGVTTASYKLRINESNRVKSLYAAESGIDMAYIEMNKSIQKAIETGIKGVTDAIKVAFEANKELTKEEKNRIFKDKYIQYVKGNLITAVSKEYNILDNTATAQVVCTLEPVVSESYQDRRVTLQSTYQSNGKERAVKVSYTLSVPDEYRVATYKGEQLSNITKYSLAADGNLKISQSQDVDIIGDVWVQGTMAIGKDGQANSVNYLDKYKGGIEIDGMSKVNFAGDVITASNINVSSGQLEFNSAKLDEDGKKVDSNIFAENVFLGTSNNVDFTDSNIKFNAENSDVFLANDLVVSSGNANVAMKNFYGFNDITTEKYGADFSFNNVAIRGSSSIIVNSNIWPASSDVGIQIGDDIGAGKAYIMGSAYIKTEKPYQTGESVALKGNYSAYTKPLEGEFDKYQFEYIDPLVLVTRDQNGKPLTIEEKAKYFVEYSKSIGADTGTLEDEKTLLRTKGIKLPNETYTVGASISNGEVKSSTAMLETQVKDVAEAKRKFVQTVYNMNDIRYVNNTKDNFVITNNDFLKGYAEKTVSNDIYWDGVNDLINKNGVTPTNVFELDGITVVLNNDPAKAIKIEDTSGLTGVASINIQGTTSSTQIKNNRKYIIVTAGNVDYKSNYDFNGSIISKGNINISSSKGKIGMEAFTAEELNSIENTEVLDQIFTLGDRTEVNLIVKPTDLVSKEKWSLVK